VCPVEPECSRCVATETSDDHVQRVQETVGRLPPASHLSAASRLRLRITTLRQCLYIVCLFTILPVETPRDHTLRERGHNFVLPRCQNDIYKISFLNKCLFSIL